MSTFLRAIKKHTDLSLEEQKHAGQPIAGDIDQEHKTYAKKIVKMLEKGELDVTQPESLINKDVYDAMPEEWKRKTDAALPNLADQLRIIEKYWKDPSIPNDAPQLQTMIEQLWQMKSRIEETYDVFIF